MTEDREQKTDDREQKTDTCEFGMRILNRNAVDFIP
jgi:hypothetical protein